MSTATRYVETDALGSLREELMGAAARRPRRRRARRAAVVVAIVVGVLAATAGAAELTGFTTGVPEVDELIGAAPPRETGPGGVRFADRRPGPGAASAPLLVPMGDGIYKTVAYLSRDGDVCVASAERHRGGVRGGGGGCPPLEDLNRQIDRRGAAWQGSAIGLDSRVNQFIVDGDVETVRPLGEGDWSVLKTPPWTPAAPGARPLRLVVVIDETDFGNKSDGAQMGEIPDKAFLQPILELTYSDGEKRVWEGPQAK